MCGLPEEETLMDALSGTVLPYSLIWAIIGVILIIAEVATMSFVLIFFGLGALLTALLAWSGITPGLGSQLLVFAISSLAMLAALRRFAKNLFFSKADASQDSIGQRAQVSKPISHGADGAVTFRGTEWIAFSDSSETILAGSTVEITGSEGIRLKVRRVS